jgi:hypothetical protein
MNMQGEVIAFLHSSNLDNFAFGLPIHYAKEALVFLVNGKKPPRQHTGMIVDYYSLDRAVKYFNFPATKVEDYKKKYPEAFNQVLRIDELFGLLASTEKQLKVGDIIWGIEGKEIGPHYYLLEKILNEAQGNNIKLNVYREGKPLDITLGLYNLYQNNINKMLLFGGAVFYESDDFIARITNAPVRSVFLTNIRGGSTFSERFSPIPGTEKLFIKIVSISGKPIRTLEDLIYMIPDLVKEKNFNLSYKNYGLYLGHDNIPIFSHNEHCLEVMYDERDGPPTLYEFEEDQGVWKKKDIFKKPS